MSRAIRAVAVGGLVLAGTLAGLVAGALIQRYSLDRILRQFGVAQYQFVPVRGGDVTLKTRRFVWSMDRDAFDTEKDSYYEVMRRPLDLEKTALVLIDTWDYHPNDGYLARVKAHMDDKLSRLIQVARDNGVRIIHSPHKIPLIPVFNREIAEACAPASDEFVLDTGLLSNPTLDFDDYLEVQGVTTLIYAGYAVNACLLIRPTGIIKMKNLGYDVILVRDCTLAWETPKSLEGEWAKRIGINLIESFWGESTTLGDIQEAFSNRGQP